MYPLTIDQLRTLVPAYVLGLLDADERAAFERGRADPLHAVDLERAIAHEIARQREEAAASVEAAASPEVVAAAPVEAPAPVEAVPPLEAATPPGTPPAGSPAVDDVRALAMARRAERNTPPRAAVVKQSSASRATRVATPPLPVAAIGQVARRTARRAWWSAAALGVGMVAAVAMAVVYRQRALSLEERATQEAALMARAETRLAAQDKTLQTLLPTRGYVVLVSLVPTAQSDHGMQVFWNVRDGKAVVHGYGFAPVASDRAYTLWMLRDGALAAITQFTPDQDGRVTLSSVEFPTSTSGVALLAVTEESSAGASQPSMAPFLAGDVPPPGAMR